MPRAKYALEPGLPKRLEVSWKIGWKDVRIRYDGQEVGAVGTPAELKQGRQFALPDGSKIEVCLAGSELDALHHGKPLWKVLLSLFLSSGGGLELLRDGKPLRGSASDPKAVATFAVFWVAIGGILIGVLDAIGAFQAASAQVVGVPWWGNVVVGVVFGVLGFFVKRGQATALAIAIVLTIGLLISQVAATIVILSQGGTPLGIGAIILTAGLLIWMVKGLKAMKGPSPATPTHVHEPVAEPLSCPQCGAQYRPIDYREDAEAWQCSSCKNPLPRKKPGAIAAAG